MDGSHALSQPDPSKPTVYFARDLSPAGVQKIYERINRGITGKVGIKLHTGKPYGPNLLPSKSRNGLSQLEYMGILGMGSRKYQLVEI